MSCLNHYVGRAEVVVMKINLEMLAFVSGMLGISLIVGWLAWSNLQFVTADAPAVVKTTVRP